MTVRSPSTTRRGPRCPVPSGVTVVLQEDAAALVADAALSLALRGRAPKITAANGPRLVRLGALMLDAFDVGTEVKEESDDRSLAP